MGLNGKYKRLSNMRVESERCKISDFIKECDNLDNLQVSIYLLKEDKFIYSNSALEKITGIHSTKILNKNWNCWFEIVCEKELLAVRGRIKSFISGPYFKTPFVLKYHIIDEKGKRRFLRHELLLHYLEGSILAINYFFDISDEEKIDTYFKVANNTRENQVKKEHSISPREKEVLILVADGFSSKQIADMLYISHHTAISHRKNLIEKFRVRNTAQLIKRASRNIELW